MLPFLPTRETYLYPVGACTLSNLAERGELHVVIWRQLTWVMFRHLGKGMASLESQTKVQLITISQLTPTE